MIKSLLESGHAELMPTWLIYALLSAFFAALVSILAKIGLKGIDSNLATAIRTVGIILFAWGIVFFQGTLPQLKTISRTDLIFLVLSGLATLLAVIFLRERVAPAGWLGIALIFAGTLVVSLAR